MLVHGAAGGLGTLALQMLSAWGANITAIARPPTLAGCLQAGATEVLDGNNQSFASLGRTFDATLNFATWTMTLRSSAACGMMLWAMRPRCIQCWEIWTGTAGCALD